MVDYDKEIHVVKIRYGSVVNNIGGFDELYYHEGRKPDLDFALRAIKNKINELKKVRKDNFHLIICICENAWIPLKEYIEKEGLSGVVEFKICDEIYTSESKFRSISEMIDESEKRLKETDGAFERFLFRGQSNEAWNVSSGLYRYLNNNSDARKIIGGDGLTIGDFQKIAFKLLDVFAPHKFKNLHELFTDHDFQHLRALTEYVDLTEDYMVAFKFANLEHKNDVLSRIFVFAEKHNEQGTHDIWTVKNIADKLVVDKKYGHGMKAFGTNSLARDRIEAQKGYFFNVSGSTNKPSLELYRGDTYSFLTNVAMNDQTISMYDQELYPDHKAGLDKDTDEKYKAIIKDLESILGINNEKEVSALLDIIREMYTKEVCNK